MPRGGVRVRDLRMCLDQWLLDQRSFIVLRMYIYAEYLCRGLLSWGVGVSFLSIGRSYTNTSRRFCSFNCYKEALIRSLGAEVISTVAPVSPPQHGPWGGLYVDM